MEATAHLEGNADEGNPGSHGALWEVFPWFQVLSAKLDKAIAKESAAHTRLRFGTSTFETSQVGLEEAGRRKLPASVMKHRAAAALRVMGIITAAKKREGTFSDALAINPSKPQTTRTTSRKQAGQGIELERWYRFRPAKEVETPFNFGLRRPKTRSPVFLSCQSSFSTFSGSRHELTL